LSYRGTTGGRKKKGTITRRFFRGAEGYPPGLGKRESKAGWRGGGSPREGKGVGGLGLTEKQFGRRRITNPCATKGVVAIKKRVAGGYQGMGQGKKSLPKESDFSKKAIPSLRKSGCVRG